VQESRKKEEGMSDMRRNQYKETHVNRDRDYEVEEIASNSEGKPSTIIPPEYWEEFKERCK